MTCIDTPEKSEQHRAAVQRRLRRLLKRQVHELSDSVRASRPRRRRRRTPKPGRNGAENARP
jgi:hypothetical protein